MADIEFFDHVFDEPFSRFLLEDSKKHLVAGKEFARSNFHWDKTIVRASQAVLIRDYRLELAGIILDQLIKRGVIGHRDYSVMNYAWTRGSYIPWHTDQSYTDAVTIYLNDKWRPDWGGLYLYRDGEMGIRGVEPRFNTGLRNLANLPHSTTPVAMDAEQPRLTLQLFTSKA